MDLPSFIWLWRIAAWSMGLSMTLFAVLGVTGLWMRIARKRTQPRPAWLRPLHLGIGSLLVVLVLLLLSIGIVGTLGEYGSLGHSAHLPAGLLVVALTLASAWSATRIDVTRPWARSLHVGINTTLLVGLLAVLFTGWSVVQKYLP
ncbi:DUF4079 domain-containing protein [Leptolyngbya sp. AN02str]|uniref:DUF4079 domain-containing protein n=1 Tax=Leptolyngbya sp. AN02str TaxID=3423363 RepID=UPI003D318849